MKKIIMTILTIIAVLIAIALIGLQVRPAPFAPITDKAEDLGSIPLPSHLPQPVDRFYKIIYGDQIPIIETAVVSGRAQMIVNGIKFPARFRFTHRAGKDYHHNIEAAFFGFPIMKVDESYINGYSRMELPFGIIEGEPKIDQAANLTLWAEAIWFPAVLLTDERVIWEAVDDSSALLHVPFEDKIETFTIRFNEETGLISSLQSMRYKETDSAAKTLWTNDMAEWTDFDGQTTLKVGEVTWGDAQKPWAVFSAEAVDINIDIRFAIPE